METRTSITVPGAGSVTCLQARPEGEPRHLVLYAPGAGSNVNDAFGAHLAGVLAGAGVESWRFRFPYMEAGRRAPDRPPVLEATWTAAIEAARATGRLPVVGGRSMGGRIASQVVANGVEVAGLVLFAYPLIPPGRRSDATAGSRPGRAEHLASIRAPVLFCSGTRDAFGTPEQLHDAVSLVPGATLHLLEGADHGFNVLKASGRRREEVYEEASQALLRFLEGLPKL